MDNLCLPTKLRANVSGNVKNGSLCVGCCDKRTHLVGFVVRAGPTRSALEIQAQAFHGHSYPNEQLVMSREHTCYIWLNHMCDNNVITAVSLQDPGRWASRRIQMRIPFICVRWPFMIRFTGDRVKTCSNKFWHDCLPAFFYNLNTISYHLYFLLIGRTLCKGSATIAYLCKEKHHNRTRAFDWSY